MLSRNDRSRQSNGLVSAMPSNQLQKSFNNGVGGVSGGPSGGSLGVSSGGGLPNHKQDHSSIQQVNHQKFYHNNAGSNQYQVNKSIGSFKN